MLLKSRWTHHQWLQQRAAAAGGRGLRHHDGQRRCRWWRGRPVGSPSATAPSFGDGGVELVDRGRGGLVLGGSTAAGRGPQHCCRSAAECTQPGVQTPRRDVPDREDIDHRSRLLPLWTRHSLRAG